MRPDQVEGADAVVWALDPGLVGSASFGVLPAGATICRTPARSCRSGKAAWPSRRADRRGVGGLAVFARIIQAAAAAGGRICDGDGGGPSVLASGRLIRFSSKCRAVGGPTDLPWGVTLSRPRRAGLPRPLGIVMTELGQNVRPPPFATVFRPRWEGAGWTGAIVLWLAWARGPGLKRRGR